MGDRVGRVAVMGDAANEADAPRHTIRAAYEVLRRAEERRSLA
jgi:hypothetical protein